MSIQLLNPEKLGNSKAILQELQPYLPLDLFAELALRMALPKGTIVICGAVARILTEYTDTQEKENQVSYLLSALMNAHFSEVDTRFP